MAMAKPTEKHRKQSRAGWLAELRETLVGTPLNTALTLVTAAFLALVLPPLFDWAILSATWTGTSGADCRATGAGACWPFVSAKFAQFMYGTYPEPERWRVNLTFGLAAVGLAALMLPRLPGKAKIATALVAVYPFLAVWLLVGGLGLAGVSTKLWGGLLITLVVAATGIAASLPLGILLALGRRSSLPLVRWLSIAFIEFWRGVPLITVLFMASVMLPLFLPAGVTFDLLLRCLIGVALFSAAYMAEVVRGGLQAIPRGQYEAGAALGLGYWRLMGLVILPQALRHVIPGIVNNFIGLFKDTTLVLIVGLADLLGIVQRNLNDPHWFAPSTAFTGYVFAGAVFWLFCFGMSRYAQHMERVLSRGSRRS